MISSGYVEAANVCASSGSGYSAIGATSESSWLFGIFAADGVVLVAACRRGNAAAPTLTGTRRAAQSAAVTRVPRLAWVLLMDRPSRPQDRWRRQSPAARLRRRKDQHPGQNLMPRCPAVAPAQQGSRLTDTSANRGFSPLLTLGATAARTVHGGLEVRRAALGKARNPMIPCGGRRLIDSSRVHYTVMHGSED